MSAKETIARLRAVHEKATPGEWRVDRGNENMAVEVGTVDSLYVCGMQYASYEQEKRAKRGEPDAAAIVAAHNSLSALLDVADAAQTLYDAHHDYAHGTTATLEHVDNCATNLRAALLALASVRT